MWLAKLAMMKGVSEACVTVVSWLLCLDFRFSDAESSYELVHWDLCMLFILIRRLTDFSGSINSLGLIKRLRS